MWLVPPSMTRASLSAQEFVKWLKAQDYKHKVVIAGNHGSNANHPLQFHMTVSADLILDELNYPCLWRRFRCAQQCSNSCAFTFLYTRHPYQMGTDTVIDLLKSSFTYLKVRAFQPAIRDSV